MRLALPQAGLLLFQASPDAPDEDLKPGTRTRAYCLANSIFTIGFRFVKRKLFTVAAPVVAERRGPTPVPLGFQTG